MNYNNIIIITIIGYCQFTIGYYNDVCASIQNTHVVCLLCTRRVVYATLHTVMQTAKIATETARWSVRTPLRSTPPCTSSTLPPLLFLTCFVVLGTTGLASAGLGLGRFVVVAGGGSCGGASTTCS